MIWFDIIIIFQDKTQNLAKFAHFEKFMFVQQWLTQKCDILGQFYVFLKTSCKDFIKKKFKWKSEKD